MREQLNERVERTAAEQALGRGNAYHIYADRDKEVYMYGTESERLVYLCAVWLCEGKFGGWEIQGAEKPFEMRADWVPEEDIFRFACKTEDEESTALSYFGKSDQEFQFVGYWEWEKEGERRYGFVMYDSRQQGEPPVELRVWTQYDRDPRLAVIWNLFEAKYSTLMQAAKGR